MSLLRVFFPFKLTSSSCVRRSNGVCSEQSRSKSLQKIKRLISLIAFVQLSIILCGSVSIASSSKIDLYNQALQESQESLKPTPVKKNSKALKTETLPLNQNTIAAPLELADPKPQSPTTAWQGSFEIHFSPRSFSGSSPNNKVGQYNISDLGSIPTALILGNWGYAFQNSGVLSLKLGGMTGTHTLSLKSQAGQVLKSRLSSYGFEYGIGYKHHITDCWRVEAAFVQDRQILNFTSQETNLGNWSEELVTESLQVSPVYLFSQTEWYALMGVQTKLSQKGKLSADSTNFSLGIGKLW